MKQGATLPVLFANGRSYSNTSLGRATSNVSLSSSIRQVFLANSCLKNAVQYRLPLKKLKPEPWQRLFYVKKQQELTIKQNNSNPDSLINKDLFASFNEHSNFDENSQCSSLPGPMQGHLDHVYEQMNEITLQLAEERLKHKQTQIKAEEILFNQLQDQEKRFQELQKHQLLDHKKKLKEQEKKFLELLNEKQMQCLKREEQLRTELEFVKQSFHTYKVALKKENDEKLPMKLPEVLRTMKKEQPKKKEDIDRKIHEAVMNERKNISFRQQNEIEEIQKQHKKEIETLQKTVADTAVDREHIESLSKNLTSTKLELVETKERAVKLATKLNDLKIQHNETIREFNEYRLRSNEKTKQP
ncbi:unnamed protein product [Rotaria sp. Silwood1]|nr:unnamed protein product [Rotaria sp. Silwood1]CAF1298473.1 unnamed protein product [Rotaria sp. Silwood1]CAF3467427.1 unnamed protein product [Rotaria sp. Silwood1]CAF3513472.1 unnamed protein product [Rotaria sp. Silwood1]CAF4753551.1 unnamed protein product [Rotaria sp. Silwood1]